MQGLYKLHGAANTLEARKDYGKLVALATGRNAGEMVPRVSVRAGWRTIDKAAQAGVEKLLVSFPDLRETLKAIYPGFVE